jgi:hypothetical protein
LYVVNSARMDEQFTVSLTMPTYINRKGELIRAYNTLTPERELELRKHVDECDVALQQCPECWLLYVSIGQDEYVKVLTGGM